ncbi:uncharacterized protein G2W53_007374 [Senna tora]|uniref:Uncharacterized protein n=1 Tax=Senna tora TaxID=362788 RepID=A0A835CH90_9FABA|nr:uncharacterized protein G2W53_007374 [Senna tora]
MTQFLNSRNRRQDCLLSPDFDWRVSRTGWWSDEGSVTGGGKRFTLTRFFDAS